MNVREDFSKEIKKGINTFHFLHANTIIRWSSRITVLLIFCAIIVLLISWKNLPTEVPLWYSKPWGRERLAHPFWLFLLPGASFGWYIVNSFLSIHVTKDHLVFSQILFLSSLVVSVFSFITLTMIVWIIS